MPVNVFYDLGITFQNGFKYGDASTEINIMQELPQWAFNLWIMQVE